MKRANSILAIILFVMAGCEEKNQAGNDDIIRVDVTKSYSSKKELIIQDFMDVEYIALETKAGFYNQGLVQAIGKEIILVSNRIDDGNIFIYDRKGKALRKLNRMGHGPEEYLNIRGITLDEENNEMYINNPSTIMVYDLFGNFKRSLKQEEGEGAEVFFYTDIFNYDRDHLICYNQFHDEIAFVLKSKQDGSIVKEIKIPCKEKKYLLQTIRDGENIRMASPGHYHSIIPYNESWILSELSADTVYLLLPDFSLRPLIVRTPSIHSMDSEIYLILRFLSDRYYFMETIKNVYDFDKIKGWPRTFFMYDMHEKALSGYIVYNGDYSSKKEMYMNVLRPVDHEIESWQPLESVQLVKDYEEGLLKGRLKEIAAGLKEEDNPVIMLIKHKK